MAQSLTVILQKIRKHHNFSGICKSTLRLDNNIEHNDLTLYLALSSRYLGHMICFLYLILLEKSRKWGAEMKDNSITLILWLSLYDLAGKFDKNVQLNR